jgi:hypothetical protein
MQKQSAPAFYDHPTPSRAVGGISGLLSNSRLLAAFNLPLAVVAGWLLWRSLDWPLIGDGTLFHFIASQIKLGAVPYRDIADVNMPLTYAIHLAIISIGGMSDMAWRAFDLIAAAIMSALVLALVWPAGRAAAITATLTVLIMHLMMGPFCAGQRDYLMSIPALAVALLSAKVAENKNHRRLCLVLAGAFAMTAASIKPSGIILALLPALAVKLTWRDMVSIAAGAAGVALLVFGTLAAIGGLGAFVTMLLTLMPLYTSLDDRSALGILAAVTWLGPIAGLGVAAALGMTAAKPPRLRAMIGLTVFGLIHLLVQRKGFSYHAYPLGIGLACWGAWSLATLTMRRELVSLIVTASTLGWLIPHSPNWPEHFVSLPPASAMQSALQNHLPRGARVQTLDSDDGAFLAMARAGMRQATPDIQWFTLMFGNNTARSDFIAALQAAPPDAILYTNDQWPSDPGFDAADDWPAFTKLLAARYDLVQTGDEDFISWRFYLRRKPASD